MILTDEQIKRIKQFTLPGFDGVPLVTVLRFLYRELKSEGVVIRGSSIAFFFILSVFPGLIFLFTLIPYLPIKHFQTDLLLTIKDVINNPGAYQMIRSTVNDIVAIPHGNLLSFGFFFALYSAMTGVKALINAFDKTHTTFKRRNMLQNNWVALKLTVLIAILVIASITLIILEKSIFGWFFDVLKIHDSTGVIFVNLLRYSIIIGLFFFTISFIYYYGPAVHKKWRFVSAGSTLATVLSILASIAFSYFVNNFGQYNKVYGSLGSIIVIMLWIYFNSIIMLIGFELNTAIGLGREKILSKKNPAMEDGLIAGQ